MTWNVHGAARPDLGRLAEVLTEARPDVVAVQEIRRGTGAAARQRGSVGTTSGSFKHNGYWPLWWRAEGLAILSPSPLDDVWRECLSHRVSRRSHRRRVAIGRDGAARRRTTICTSSTPTWPRTHPQERIAQVAAAARRARRREIVRSSSPATSTPATRSS